MSAIANRISAALMFSVITVAGVAGGQALTDAPAFAKTCNATGPGYSDMPTDPGSAPQPTCTDEPEPTTAPPAPKPTATQPAPKPTATQPAPKPTATQPAPKPTATQPAPVAPVGQPNRPGQPRQVAQPNRRAAAAQAPAAAVTSPAPPVLNAGTAKAHTDVAPNTALVKGQPDSGNLPLWILIAALLLMLLVAGVLGIRAWLLSGHKWNAKVRRVVAGPEHTLHHNLLLDAAKQTEEEQAEEGDDTPAA